MDPRVAACLDDLRSGEEDRCERALEALDALGAEAVPDLLDLVRDADERVRAAAVAGVARHGDGAPATVRAVLRGAQAALRAFEDPAAAAEVHEAVLALSEPIEALVPVLLADAAGPDAEARLAAARDLETVTHYCGTAGAEEEALVGALVASLGDFEGRVRWWAAGALGNLALDPARSVPSLVRSLDDPEPVVRGAAVDALERFGPAAGPAIPALLPLLDAAEPEVAARAVLVVARVGSRTEGVHSRIAERVGSPEPRVRAAACAALGEIGHATAETRRAIAAALRDPD
ncbi:MAG TPA: HEAT repeat domain-containing protein, partial [Planctomycetota bacterium]|nr:HEAT repeat domain-containing protein [Planctomycetota bacterium]